MRFLCVLNIRFSNRLIAKRCNLSNKKSIFTITISVRSCTVIKGFRHVSLLTIRVNSNRRFRIRDRPLLLARNQFISRLFVRRCIRQLCSRRFHRVVDRSSCSSKEVRGFRVPYSLHGRSGNYSEDTRSNSRRNTRSSRRSVTRAFRPSSPILRRSRNVRLANRSTYRRDQSGIPSQRSKKRKGGNGCRIRRRRPYGPVSVTITTFHLLRRRLLTSANRVDSHRQGSMYRTRGAWRLSVFKLPSNQMRPFNM